MNEFDLDRLGDVWRTPPDPAETEKMRAAAEAVRLRARWSQIADHALAFIVAAVVITLIIANPRPGTGLIGGAALLLLLHSTVRQRQLRQIEIRSLAGTTEEMLDQSIERARATVKRARLGLIGSVPGFILGIGLAAATDSGTGGPLARITTDPGVTLAVIVALGLGLAAVLLHLFRRLQQTRRILQRLIETRQVYQSESDQTNS
jgi:hypothetical protein